MMENVGVLHVSGFHGIEGRKEEEEDERNIVSSFVLVGRKRMNKGK